MKSRVRKQRAFTRDSYIGLRVPDDDKRRLMNVCRENRRDVSSLVLEFILKGVKQLESEMKGHGIN